MKAIRVVAGWILALLAAQVVGGEVSAPGLLFHQVPETFSTQTPWPKWSALGTVQLHPDAALQADGEQDISAETALGWNSTALFAVVRVRDDVFSPNDVFGMFWNGDSIQLALDPQNDTGERKYDGNDISIGAADFPLGKRVVPLQVPVAVPKEAWERLRPAIDREGAATLYCLALPWSVLGQLNPLKDDSFKFNLIVNDNDGGKREGWLELSDGIGEGLNIAKCPVARFGRLPDAGAQLFITTDQPQYDISDPLSVTISTRDIEPGTRLMVKVADTVGNRDFADGGVGEITIAFANPGWAAGDVPVRAVLTTASGKSITHTERMLTVSDKQTNQRIANQAREQLAQARALLTQARDQGRAVGYLDIRAHGMEHALRLIDLAKRTYKQRDGSELDLPDVAARAVAYLQATGPVLLADAKKAATDPAWQGFEIPSPDLQQPWSVKDGQVMAGGQPVTLHGWVWNHEQRDSAVHPEDFAQNLRGLNPGPRSFMPNSWEVESNGSFGGLIKLHHREISEAQAANEAVDMLLSPHYQPRWFLDLPAIDNQFTQWHRYNGWWINTPEGQKLMDRFYAAMSTNYSQYSSLKTSDLSNEWVFYDATPEALNVFRAWLKEQYGSIGQLNSRWGTSFADFADVPNPVPSGEFRNHYNPMTPEGIYRRRGPYWDWNRFNNTRSSQTVQWMHDRVKHYMPDTLTHNKSIFTSWAHRDLAKNFIMGCDPQKTNAVTDLVGTDGSHAQGGNWKPVLFTYDYFTSMHPEKPIFNSEWHAYPYEGEGANVVRRAKFQYAVHGERLNLLFLNTTTRQPTWFGKDGSFPEMNIGAHPAAMETYALACADVRRLTPELGRFSQRKADLLIFYDNAADFEAPDSGRDGGAYGWRCVRLHTSLLPYDLRVGIVTEAMLDRGIPEQPLIVLAGARYVSDRTVSRLAEYVKAGGTILWMGQNLGFDHYGHPRPRGVLSAFGGPSRVIRVDLEPDLVSLRQGVLQQVGIRQPITARVLGGDLNHLELLSAQLPEGHSIVFLANTGPGRLELALAVEPGAMTDLVSGKTLDPTRFTLSSNDVRLLRIDNTDDR